MPSSSQQVQKIGVITGVDLIGDALIKLPFLRALRNAYPQAEIHWITVQGATTFATILREMTKELIDVIHQQPVWLKAGSGVKPPFFDILIDTRSRWRDVWATRKLPHGLFLSRSKFFLLSDRRPPFFGPRPRHLCDRLLQFVELAAGYKPPSMGGLPIPENLAQQARRVLPDGPVYIGLAPGCSSTHRMWPRERFVQLARLQVEKGRVPVFILGPMESDAYDLLKSSVPEAKFPLQETEAWGGGPLTLNHTLAIGPQLALAVTNDSGPGHMMAAVNCPVVSLFGPTTPVKAAPRVSRGFSVRAQEFGSDQMDAIPVSAVDAAVDRMLRFEN
jgi:ADP-heptose:LPS heptosyltransferase